MFKHMVFSSALAGIAAALLLSVLQMFWVTPLILQAEMYEVAAEADAHAHTADDHTHNAVAWQPEDGWQRTVSTISSNALMAIAFALMLTGAYALRKPSGILQGLAWGLAGYTVFFAAPSLGLPPDLPGTSTAAVLSRQGWWLATALATAFGLGLLLLQGRWSLRLLGALAMITPHLLGAPQPEIVTSLAPEALQTQFRWASTLTNGAFWTVLGMLSTITFNRTPNQP
ncbi:CbtA family protein [Methylomonas sp. EbB]|uniref:CbtA family protein n=2 Tax=Methylomonas fluvii TaxID=1854564 RepID=A0ABR9D9X7_9GAMM|nr:CbtA family protein [Methylomonas fluvii]MBD9359910.1 CbtA family protein [Methylomonas fluvii]CAD6872684.1 Predicted cobalt transporter CbtA [Methylomonas fluvii]